MKLINKFKMFVIRLAIGYMTEPNRKKAETLKKQHKQYRHLLNKNKEFMRLLLDFYQS